MTRKTAALYQAVLQEVHELVPQFQPTQVIADFQEAPIAAVCAVFGNDVAVSGCWFHFVQAIVDGRMSERLAYADSFPMTLVSSAAASW